MVHKNALCSTLAIILAALLAGAAQAQDILTKLDAYGTLDGTVHVRWITAQGDPAKCTVEYGPTTELGQSVEEDPSCLRGTTNNRDAGTGFANNHRVDIEGVDEWPVYVRVSGVTRGGDEFGSETVRVDAPVQPVGQTERGEVPITIHAGGWELERLPITVGLPFAKGALAGAENVRILVDGEEVTSQPDVVTRWREDNTVKWLRVSFVAPRDADEAALEYGTAVERNAALDAAMPTAGLDLREAGMAHTLVAADGKVYEGVVEDSEAEVLGAVVSSVKGTGHYIAEDGAQLCGFVIRVHAWNDARVIRTDYTFENDNTEEEFTAIRSLELGGAPAVEEVTIGLGDAQVTLADGERLLQREDFEWVKEPGDEKGRRVEGVLKLGADNVVVIRNFWQQWPMSIGLRDGETAIGLCPRLPEGFYADRKDEDKLYYQIRDGLHTFRQGFSKTWEIWSTDASVTGAATMGGDKPVASVPPSWVEDSGALLGLGVASRDQFAGYDEVLAKGIDGYLEVQDRRREYGMMNVGDWYGERTWNWGNLEYDLGHGFLTQFARSEKPEFFWRAEEALMHQRDVDTRHYASDPRRVGQQWTHSMGHTAGYYPPEYKKMKIYASPGWSDNRGHIWSQGMFEHYLMGGDVRSWETAKLVSDVYGGPGMTNYRFGNAREPGWVTKMQMGAYLATEDLFYLNAASIMLDEVHKKSVATGEHGFYYHKLPNGHCNCPDEEKHYGEAGFMLGVLMTGMKMYYDVTGDETVADDIVKTARFIADTMWVPEVLGFRYTSCPKTGASAGRAWIQMQGMAFAAHHANDLELAEICRKATAAGWSSLPTSGKSAGYILCASAQALEELGKLPGGSFGEYRERVQRALQSPARRLLPTNVPNPDFEEEAYGWPSRGWDTERCVDVKHSGEASLKISGKIVRQNEYVNTRYATSGEPYEITWLKPGETCLLSAWLRVDSITEGTPAPNLRVQFRDETGSKGSKSTSKYDLSKMGTWQELTCEFTVPDYNTRNYIALNTNSKEEIEVEMYLDDISVVPADLARDGAYAYLRLAPDGAELTGGATALDEAQIPGRKRVVGPGAASWTTSVPQAGEYVVWMVVDGGAELPELSVAGRKMAAAAPDEPTWVRYGTADLAAGDLVVKVEGLAEGQRFGTIVLTTDPSSSF